MATYLDLFAAVRRGIRYPADLAVELYYPQDAVDAATAALRDAGIVQFVQVEGRGTRIELTPAAADEASALKRAKAAGFDLEAEIPGGN